ncbi:hypothetical protein IMSAGC018_02094 [Lachnospiraceae bacterium]|nr:hypothetical protein IMSAGC018_02094 [Lachnospiraceae bacterium]
MAGNKLTHIQAYRNKKHMNIGLAIFGIIFIYLVVTVLLYLTGTHVSAYEVREGSILKDNAYTGFVLRNEVVVQAEADGYVNYFAMEGSKVGVKTRVYTLSDRELDFADTTSDESRKLSSDEQAAMLLRVQAFSEGFEEERFSDVYSLKDTVKTVLESRSNQNRQAQLDAMAGQENSGIQIYQASSDGIIAYSTDGYETMQLKDISEATFSKENYEKSDLKNNMEVKAGSPVYKLIKNDNWTVVILLQEETAEEMREIELVRVRFSKDQETAVAEFSIQEMGNLSLGVLKMDSSMIRYAKERYLDLELILEDESGLKIPKSAVIDKKFYLISEEYLTQGGNSKETGVLVKKEEGAAKFQSVNIYDRDEETGMAYLGTDAFEEDTILVKPDSTDTCVLNRTESIKGVYNINKGYAVFRQVHILCESDEYYIVEAGSDYGLSNYDHIALNGADVNENDVVF